MEMECNRSRGGDKVIYADSELARRLESLICAEYGRLVAVAERVVPEHAPELLEVAGGVAAWFGEGSPVNGSVGLGMNGPVDDDDLDRLEAFYHERGVTAAMSVCPLADPSLLHLLGRRGWIAMEFEHVLALELTHASDRPGRNARAEVARERAELSPDLDNNRFAVRVCLPEERETWGRTAARGFGDGLPEVAHEEFGRLMADRDDAILLLAWVGDRPAGTGALVVEGGVGWLSGDSTAPEYRRQGIQQAIQRHRLELARAAGCDLAVTEAVPGGGSQRNMERLGFRIVYTHVQFAKPL